METFTMLFSSQLVFVYHIQLLEALEICWSILFMIKDFRILCYPVNEK